MASDGFGTTLRVLFNSVAFFVLLIMAVYLMKYNPIWGALMILSAFDQLEDVYFYVTSNRLLPAWVRPVDIILEGILAIVGISIAVFSLVYWYTFDSMFFQLLLIASAFMAWSAIEDIVDGFNVISAKMRGESIASVKGTSNFKFFRRI